MTNEERFERWWATVLDHDADPLSAREEKRIARAAWNAALPEDVREACIEALSVCESRCRRHGWVSEKYAAARKYLEGND